MSRSLEGSTRALGNKGRDLVFASMDRLSFGFAVFDQDLTLVSCNRAFRDLRGLPSALCEPGTHISEIYRFNAERGDYGAGDVRTQVESRVVKAGKSMPSEREYELATGRILNIRYQPIPSGGLLVSYIDVTQRRHAEIALEERVTRSMQVEQAATEGIYEWMIDKGELHPSPRLGQIFGFSADEVGPRNWEWNKRIHPDDFDRYKTTLRTHFKGHSAFHECEYRVRDKAGEYRWVLDRGVCTRDQNGRAIRMVGAVGDITRHKQTEAALRESESRYEIALQAINEAVYDWDVESGEVYYSPRLHKALGISADALATAGDWMERIHPEDQKAWKDATVAHLKGLTERFECEVRYRAPDDEWRWVRTHGLALRDKSGRAFRMVGSTGDITDLKQKEIELASKTAILETTLENMDQGISMIDGNLRVIAFNKKFHELLDLPPGRFELGYHIEDAFRYNAQRGEYGEGDIEQQVRDRVEQAGRFEPHHFERTRPDGTVIEIHGMPMPNQSGFVTTYTDVTERKRREIEISEKTATLEELSNKLSKYLSPQVYASIFSGEQQVEIASERKKLTVFFSDIAGFTETTDSLESEELTSLLNQYLTEMSAIALEHGATIDKFVGDAIMVFFGDPQTKGARSDAIGCVKMAIEMQRRMHELQSEWRDRGLERVFRLRMGINTGYCTVGNFGSEDRMDYTIIGNEVNLAARLQTHAELGGILMSNETYSLVKDVVLTEKRDALDIKGFFDPVQTYKVLGLYDDLAAQGRVIHQVLDGFSLTVDTNKLSIEKRETVLKILRDTAGELEKQNGN